MGTSDFKESQGKLIDTNGCILLTVSRGYGIASINFKQHALRKWDTTLLFYDDVFCMDRVSNRFSVRFVALPYELVKESISSLSSHKSWDTLYEHPIYRPSREERKVLKAWLKQMEWIMQESSTEYRDEILRSNFHTLLLAVDDKIVRRIKQAPRSGKNRNWQLITDFSRLLPKQCHVTREVQFYAAKLCITVSYLNKLCRAMLRASPKELIDRQVTSEIKTYLANSDLSIKGIARELNFEDTSYLCRYFRRKTGMSPSEYRNKATRS